MSSSSRLHSTSPTGKVNPLNSASREGEASAATVLSLEGRVLVIHEDRDTQAQLERMLSSSSYLIDLACDADEGLALLKASPVDLIVLNYDLQNEGNLATMNLLREVAPLVPILLLSKDDDPEIANDALRRGAYDFLTHPIDTEHFLATARSAVMLRRFNRESFRLMRGVEESRPTGGPVGHSRAFRQMMEQAYKAAVSDSPVLLVGELGTGKKLMAKTIHATSRLAQMPFLSQHSSNMTEQDLEEFFSDTEADGREASCGTLFLDEVEELASKAQAVLARALESSRSTGRRSAQEAPLFRVICSTSVALGSRVSEGSFDENLFEALEVLPIHLPPLRERREDIPLLATWFLDQAVGDQPHKGFTLESLMLLEVLPWPGNLRELKQAVERAWILAEGEAIRREHILGPAGAVSVNHLDPGMVEDTWLARKLAGVPPIEADVLPFEEEERRILDRALQATGGNVTKAAQLLRIGRATLYRKIHQYSLRDLKQRHSRPGWGPIDP